MELEPSLDESRIRSLRLAYIIGTYPEITTTFIDREMQALQDMGVQIQVLSIRQPKKSVTNLEEYVQIQKNVIYLFPIRWASLFFAHLFFFLFRPKVYFNTLFFLFTRPHPRFTLRLKTLLHFCEGVYAAYLLRGRDWDHLHAHFIDRAATVALVVSRLLNVPYSVTAHADDIFSEPVLAAEKLSEAMFCVTVSEFNKAHLLQTYPVLESKKLVVLHPWIDLTRFSAPAVRPENDRFCILSVGRLVENKGHQYLIEACNLLHKEGLNFEGQVIGEGPLRPELEARIAHYDLQGGVTLLGQQPQSVVLDYLCRANVFVLACTVGKDGARDGMPVAIAEAMAMMVPVISTDIVGIGEMVRPGAGYLVPDKDPHALADAIRKVYRTSPSLRSEMGFYGRTVITENFDLHSGVRKLASLFAHSAYEGWTYDVGYTK